MTDRTHKSKRQFSSGHDHDQSYLTDRAEQLNLFNPNELIKLQSPLASRVLQEREIPPPKTTRVPRTRRQKGDAVQDKLPGF